MICVCLSSQLAAVRPSAHLGCWWSFRILQGAGGGACSRLAQATLAESFSPSKRGMAMAVFAMGVVVAPIVGPTVGGWITDNYSWRWIFFIQHPVGLLSLAMTSAFIEDPPYLKRRDIRTARIDYIAWGSSADGPGGACTKKIVLDQGRARGLAGGRIFMRGDC